MQLIWILPFVVTYSALPVWVPLGLRASVPERTWMEEALHALQAEVRDLQQNTAVRLARLEARVLLGRTSTSSEASSTAASLTVAADLRDCIFEPGACCSLFNFLCLSDRLSLVAAAPDICKPARTALLQIALRTPALHYSAPHV